MIKYPKVCIVGLKCYDLLSGAETPRYLGGIENQLVLLAQGLASRGFPVSVVTFDHGQPNGIEYNGIVIYKAFVSDKGMPFIRFVHPRWTGLCAALERADADIYYQMGAGCETGQVAIWCRKKHKRFVFATASDANCVPELPSLRSCREKYLYCYGLKNADIVISQTNKQRRLLEINYRVSSEVIRIFSSQPPNRQITSETFDSGKRRRILWIGRITPEKCPHLILDIALKLPEYTFDVIGEANVDTEYAQDFRKKAEKIPSIILHGKVSNEFLNKMFDKALLLIGTSRTEGFPVIFIEAWSRGIPVLSTFDPDGVIAKHGLGWHVSSIEEFVCKLRTALGNREELNALSVAARLYYKKNHSVNTAMVKFQQLFSNIFY